MSYGKLPRFAQAAGRGFIRGRVFNRDRFLDGTYQTYFAPGQTPNVVNPYQPSYTNPTDWRPVGGILTPPQVVWFTVAPILGPYNQTFTNGVYVTGYSVSYSPPLSPTPAPGTLVTVTWSTYFADGYTLSQTVTFKQGSGGGGPGGQNYDWTVYPAPQSKYSYPLYISGYQPPGTVATNPDVANAAAGTISMIRNDTTDPPQQPQSSSPNAPGYNAYWNPQGYPGMIAWWNSCAAANTVVYNQSVVDLMGEQADRLTGIFNEVIDRLASLRPGKTWARLNTISSDAFNNGEYYSFDPCLSFEIAPPSAQPFFGVDFLHMHTLAFSGGGNLPTLNPEYYQFDYVPGSEAQLSASYRNFFRYSAMVYGPDGTYGRYPSPALVPGGPGTPTTVVVDNILVTSGNPNITTINDNRTYLINGQNAYLASLVPETASFLESECDNVSQYGVTYMGTQSQLESADQVIELIANHFHFDPETGVDLPIPTSG